MKKQIFPGIAIISMLTITACSTSRENNNNAEMSADTAVYDSRTTAYAEIKATKADTSGSGTADFTILENGTVQLRLVLDFPLMANKSVAVHIHEQADCGDAGELAHGHWNPTDENHGKWGQGNYHSGDIGNIQLDANGKASFTMSTIRWTIGRDPLTNILERSIIVHSAADDYTSQPAGNSGSRIGCGVIR